MVKQAIRINALGTIHWQVVSDVKVNNDIQLIYYSLKMCRYGYVIYSVTAQEARSSFHALVFCSM